MGRALMHACTWRVAMHGVIEESQPGGEWLALAVCAGVDARRPATVAEVPAPALRDAWRCQGVGGDG